YVAQMNQIADKGSSRNAPTQEARKPPQPNPNQTSGPAGPALASRDIMPVQGYGDDRSSQIAGYVPQGPVDPQQMQNQLPPGREMPGGMSPNMQPGFQQQPVGNDPLATPA